MSQFVTDQLLKYATQVPDLVAISVNDEEQLTFGQWETRSNRVAHWLVERGVEPGVRLGLLYGGTNWVEYAIAYLGVLKAAGTCVHLPTQSVDEEILRRADQCHVQGIIHGAEVTIPAGWTGWSEPVPPGEAPPGTAPRRPHPDGAAEIVYSSGTTGLASGVIVPNANLTVQSGPDQVVATDAPVPMVASVRLGLTASSTTLNMVLQSRPSPVLMTPPDDVDRMAELIERHRIETVMVTPHLGTLMLAQEVGARHDLSSVKTWATASSAMPGPVAAGLLDLSAGSKVLAAYSASQVKPAVLVTQIDPERPDVIGRPTPGTEILITDEDDHWLPAGNVGRLWLRSVKAPMRIPVSEDAQRRLNKGLGRDGWVDTGDLAWMDTDGVVHLFDRASDAIRAHEGLVSSLVIENALQTVDEVLDAAVVGIQVDEACEVECEEVPVAVVVTRPVVVSELTGHLEETVGTKLEGPAPVAAVVIDEVPRNPLGKPNKAAVRELIEESVAEELREAAFAAEFRVVDLTVDEKADEQAREKAGKTAGQERAGG